MFFEYWGSCKKNSNDENDKKNSLNFSKKTTAISKLRERNIILASTFQSKKNEDEQRKRCQAKSPKINA